MHQSSDRGRVQTYVAIIGDTVMVLNVVYTVESNIVLFQSASVVTGFFLRIKHRCSEPHARMNEHASKRNQCVAPAVLADAEDSALAPHRNKS